MKRSYTFGVLFFVVEFSLCCHSARSEEPYQLAWSRQFGTSKTDVGFSAAVGASGNVYVTGATDGSLSGTNAGTYDGFLSKYTPAGSLVWSRQFGTSGADEIYSVAVDSSEQIYISGRTNGSLASLNAGDYDAFLAKYDAAGALLWSRQLGTSRYDIGAAVAVDASGNAYISGHTEGSLGSPNAGFSDAFLRKYDPAGNVLWTRQLGTISWNESSSVAVDALGNAYMSGYTNHDLGAAYAGGYDAFLVKYDPTGNLVWLRQIGSEYSEYSFTVDVDAAGNAYIAGETNGTLPGNTSQGGHDAFVAKYDVFGTLLWSRQFGTSAYDATNSITVDAGGNSYLTGRTQGSFGAPNAGDFDIYLTKFDASGNNLWTRQLGTSGYEASFSVALGPGSAYITGYSEGALAGQKSGLEDATLFKFIVPEPTTLVLLIFSIAALLPRQRR